MSKISLSPQRHSFQEKSTLDKLKKDPQDQGAQDLLDWYEKSKSEALARQETLEWQKDNLEYDLRSTEWILEKVRSDDVYAQHLYAAMCNVDFVKNDPWPVLKDTRWSCSWRHAGGIIADMQEKGDYIDWYCSGMRGDDISEDDFKKLSEEGQLIYRNQRAYVGEGKVTDEIRQDLLKLGWIVKDDYEP